MYVGREAGEGDAFLAQPGLGVGFAGVTAVRIGGAGFIQGPLLRVGIDTSRTHVNKAMAGGPGDGHHAAAVLLLAAGAVDDHIEAAALERAQTFIAAAVATEVFHAGGDGVLSAGEQGECMALGLQGGPQGAGPRSGFPPSPGSSCTWARKAQLLKRGAAGWRVSGPTPMEIIPAIDLLDGACVRLHQG